MNTETACSILRPLLSAASLAMLLPLLCPAQTPRLTLWYRQPVAVLTEALSIGNAHLGATVFGGANRGSNNGDQQDARGNADIKDDKQTRAQDEHLKLNESTVWQGSPSDKLNSGTLDGFRKVRSLLIESKGKRSVSKRILARSPSGPAPTSLIGSVNASDED